MIQSICRWVNTSLRWSDDDHYRSPRGLDKALILQLGSGQWLRDGLNLIICGPTGVGKTWLACALAHKACRDGYSVRYACRA